jgi:RNA polymerase subunit RPABC4/transcription elongation factor Spt4
LLTLSLFLPGYWLYLILRPRLTLSEKSENILRERVFGEYSTSCPKCHQLVREEFIVCPSCQNHLKSACVGCSHALQASWLACPYCGRTTGTSAPQLPAAAIFPDVIPVESLKPIHS